MRLSRLSAPVLLLAIVVVAATPALASGSGVAALDSSVSNITNIFKVVCAILGLGLLVAMLAEFAGHKHLGKLGIEFAGIIVCILLAVNAGAILTLFGVSSAVIK